MLNITNTDIEEAKARQVTYQAVLVELIRKHSLAVNDLTEKQFAEAIRQACACWDFQRLVVTTGEGAQQVIYIPFAEQSRLQARIQELEERLRLAKIRCTVCGEYLPGHATGGADICTCT